MADKKRCFVVMGFGIKTDLATGRKLNLDNAYRNMIKPAVEQTGLECEEQWGHLLSPAWQRDGA